MNKIYIMGDIHGDYKPIRSLYYYLKSGYDKHDIPDGSDWIILLGDFGGNYYFNYRDDTFKKALGKFPFKYFIIRGNHEERPSYCYEEYPSEWELQYNVFDNYVYVEKEYPYIFYAKDCPSVYYINYHRTLILPGAYSVDKYFRLANGWSWFKDEQMTEKERKDGLDLINKNFKNYDIVLSHTCPISYEPTDLFISSIDQNMVDKTTEKYLEQIEHELKYKLWCWGHFHKTRIYPTDSNEADHIMLFNEAVLDLNKYFRTKNLYDSLCNFSKISSEDIIWKPHSMGN
jgi:3-oxoacid CoA-transferase subunit A